MAYLKFNKKVPTDPFCWAATNAISDGIGGGSLDLTNLDLLKNGGYLLKGCPLALTMVGNKRTLSPVKSALVIAGGTTTAPRVDKKHLFIIGDTVYVTGDAVTINSIDTTNADYDVLTLSAACTGATAGAYLEQSVAAGASPVRKRVAVALSADSVEMNAGALVTPIIRINQWVEKKLIPHTISPAIIADLKTNIVLI